MVRVMYSDNKGFTLIELMVTVAIVAIIAAFAIPQFNNVIQRRYLAAAADSLRNALTQAGTLARVNGRNVVVVPVVYDTGTGNWNLDNDKNTPTAYNLDGLSLPSSEIGLIKTSRANLALIQAASVSGNDAKVLGMWSTRDGVTIQPIDVNSVSATGDIAFTKVTAVTQFGYGVNGLPVQATVLDAFLVCIPNSQFRAYLIRVLPSGGVHQTQLNRVGC